VPLVPFIRSLGPPLVVLAVGAVLLVRRRPVRARLMWAALAVQLAAAAMPYAWLAVQTATGLGGQTWVGLAMIMLQPGVDAIAWLLALGAVVAAAPRRRREGKPPAVQADRHGAGVGTQHTQDTQAPERGERRPGAESADERTGSPRT